MAIAMSADEKRWRAEDDARTIKRMAELEADKGRKAEAIKLLKVEQKQLTKALSTGKTKKK